MDVCFYLTPAEKAVLEAAGWQTMGGPFPTENSCDATCGDSSSSSEPADYTFTETNFLCLAEGTIIDVECIGAGMNGDAVGNPGGGQYARRNGYVVGATCLSVVVAPPGGGGGAMPSRVYDDTGLICDANSGGWGGGGGTGDVIWDGGTGGGGGAGNGGGGAGGPDQPGGNGTTPTGGTSNFGAGGDGSTGPGIPGQDGEFPGGAGGGNDGISSVAGLGAGGRVRIWIVG